MNAINKERIQKRELYMLQQKTALITGSTSGIGLGIATSLARQGARIMLNGFGDIEQAKAIIASLKKGGKFEDIAKKQSKDPGSGAKGGDLDWANASSFVKEFSTAIVSLKKVEVTQAPVKSQFGFHVIRLDDIRDAQLPKIEEVKPQILQQLQSNKLAEYQQSLREKAKIE